jgi:hypothetical protein
MDESTTALILELMKEDVDETIDNLKGKQPVGHLTDRELALEIWSHQIERETSTFADYRMARSIARAVQDDGVAITVAFGEEQRAADDRRTALRLGGHNTPDPNTQLERTDPGSIEKVLEKIDEFILGKESTSSPLYPTILAIGTHAESSRSAANINHQQLECIACTESRSQSDVVEAPCKDHHVYCRDCAVRLFEESIRDITLFPPRCCGVPIPLSSVRELLGAGLVKQFEEKSIERNDLYRTYCSNPVCPRYIFPDRVQSYIGTCNNCSKQTCTLCKQAAHLGKYVDERGQVLEIARKEEMAAMFSMS